MNITYHNIFGGISGLLMILGMFPYVYSIIITKETKLNRASWAIWSSLGLINLAAYLSAGEKETIWFVIVAAINPFIIFILSLKFGEKNWYKSDTACLMIAVVALIIWRVTGSPVLALAAGLTADGLGIIPTFLKIRRNPFSENLVSWLFLLAANICNIIAIKEWTWANGVYNIYCFSGSLVIITPIVLGQILLKPISK